MVRVAGVDNGVSGWIAVVEGDKVIDCLKYPRGEETKIIDFLKKNEVKQLVLEEPLMMSRFKHVSGIAFELLGVYKLSCMLANVPFEVASPRQKGWRYSLGYKSTRRADFKEESIQKACDTYSNAEEWITYKRNAIVDHKRTEITCKDDNLADSIMLAKYAEAVYEKNNSL